MNSNLHTYFFFWYPSNVLSPLNLLLIFANSLLIRLISASLLLPKKEQEFLKQMKFQQQQKKA